MYRTIFFIPLAVVATIANAAASAATIEPFANIRIGFAGPSGAETSDSLTTMKSTMSGFPLVSVADFDPADFGFGGQVTDLANATLTLTTYSSAGGDGNFAVFLVSNTGLFNTLTTSNSGTNYTDFHGVNDSFGTRTLLGTFAYVDSGGAQTTYTLDISSAETDLIDLINNNQTIRLVMAGTGVNVLHLWASRHHTSLDGPQLTIEATVVPEPSSFVLLGLGLTGLVAIIGRRRLRSTG